MVEFLVLSETFPRSLRFCLKELNYYLHAISETSVDKTTNDAERVCGKLLSQLSRYSADDIFKEGLHEYLDRTQIALNDIGNALYHTYMYVPPAQQPGAAA
jgi:uncharacterized alpha-E superfamily protein